MNNFNQAPFMPPTNDGSGMSVASLVCGIISIVLGCFSPIIPFIGLVILAASILGIVFGVIGRGASIKTYGKASGIATAGFIVSILALCLSPITLLCNLCVTWGTCQACTVCSLIDFATLDSGLYY